MKEGLEKWGLTKATIQQEMMFSSINEGHLSDRKTLLAWWRAARLKGMEDELDGMLRRGYVGMFRRVNARLEQAIREEYPDIVDRMYRDRGKLTSKEWT